MEKQEIPIGFGFALAQNPEAMKRFSALPQTRQAEILQKAHQAASEQQMQSLVNSLTAQG